MEIFMLIKVCFMIYFSMFKESKYLFMVRMFVFAFVTDIDQSFELGANIDLILPKIGQNTDQSFRQ